RGRHPPARTARPCCPPPARSRTRSDLGPPPSRSRRLSGKTEMCSTRGVTGTEHLKVERHGATVVVTMDRPEAKNALSPAMLVGLADAWAMIDGDDEVRCAVLTGAGGTFCTGMELKGLGGGGQENPDADR